MGTNVVLITNQLAAAAAKRRAALRAKAILNVERRLANGALASVILFGVGVGVKGQGCFLLPIILIFQHLTAMRTNHCLRINFLIAKGTVNSKFRTAAAAKSIVRVDGRVAGRAKFLLTLWTLVSIMGNNCMAGRATA